MGFLSMHSPYKKNESSKASKRNHIDIIYVSYSNILWRNFSPQILNNMSLKLNKTEMVYPETNVAHMLPTILLYGEHRFTKRPKRAYFRRL